MTRSGQNRLIHAARGIFCATCLMENVLPHILGIQHLYKNTPSLAVLRENEEKLRRKCNAMYENNILKSYYIPETENTLMQKLFDSNNTKEFRYE